MAPTTRWGRLHWLWHLYPPSVSWGMHSFPYIPSFVCLRWAHLREKVCRRKLQTQSEPFRRRESQEWWGLYGRIPLNQPLSWLSWRWGAKCHANSSVGPEKEQVPSQRLPLFCLLRIACCLRQMPQLINALPLAQQLSNKQVISVGLLSVFYVTERQRARGGGPKYSKPIRWDPVYASCSFICCFWNADFPLSFTSVHQLILKALMEGSVNNLAASST